MAEKEKVGGIAKEVRALRITALMGSRPFADASERRPRTDVNGYSVCRPQVR
jgi:hypothetical protein